MTRSIVGWSMVVVLTMPGWVRAQTFEDPRVSITRGDTAAVVTLETKDLVATQSLSPGGVALALEAGGDAVRLSGDAAGRVTVARDGARHTFSIREAVAADQTTVAAILGGSSALRRFDELMRSQWSRTARAARLFAPVHAMVTALGGDHRTVAQIAASLSTPAPALTLARQKYSPDACWTIYSHDVLKFTYDLEACMAEARESLNPLRTMWCAYEYNIKASLAMIWMLDCYGV